MYPIDLPQGIEAIIAGSGSEVSLICQQRAGDRLSEARMGQQDAQRSSWPLERMAQGASVRQARSLVGQRCTPQSS